MTKKVFLNIVLLSLMLLPFNEVFALGELMIITPSGITSTTSSTSIKTTPSGSASVTSSSQSIGMSPSGSMGSVVLNPSGSVAINTDSVANSTVENIIILDPIKLRGDFGQNQKGKILLEVENDGRAWYVNPKNEIAYFLGRPSDAFQVMREQGVGITNADLERIPVSLDGEVSKDSDNDGLDDLLENAIGTDINKKDTDGDGFEDRQEMLNGYDPKVSGGKADLDSSFSDAQKGKILLQVDGSGEAWYVNPADGRRHFLGRPSDAFSVMRKQGVGISNNDFRRIK